MSAGRISGGGAVHRERKAARAVTVAVGLALVAGACQTDRKITEPDPVPVTEERLTEALLTAEDLGGAFTAADEGTPISTEPLPEHQCDDAIGDLESREEATAAFTGTGSTLSSTVAWLPGGGGATEQAFLEALEDCASVVAPDDGLAIRTKRLDFGVLSDDTLALQIEVEPTAGNIEERDVIVLRSGDLVSVIRLTGPRPSDKVLLDEIVRLALGRLGLLADLTS
jgi:hypothetical protein